MFLKKYDRWNRSLDSYNTMHQVSEETKLNLGKPEVIHTLGEDITFSLLKWLDALRIKMPAEKLSLTKRQIGGNAIIAACLNDEEVEVETKTGKSFTNYQKQSIIETFRKWGIEDHEGYAVFYIDALKNTQTDIPQTTSFADTDLLGITTYRSATIASDGMPDGIGDRMFFLRPSMFLKRTSTLESMSTVLVHELVHVAQTQNNCIQKPAKNTMEKDKFKTSSELQAYYIQMLYTQAAYGHIEADQTLTTELERARKINDLREEECSAKKPFEATGKLVKLLKEVGFDITIDN